MAQIRRNGVLYGTGELADLPFSDTGLVATNANAALKELNSNVGDIGTLTTTANTSAISAINELNTNVGDITTLTTTANTDAVSAINELDSKLPFALHYDAVNDKYGYVDNLGGFNPFSAGIDFIAQEFDASTRYEKGDYVMHSDTLYVRTAIAGSGAWSAGDWQQIKLAEISGTGGMKKKLLWTNPSPTASFAAQTVAIDLSAYDYIIVEAQASTTNIIKYIYIKSVDGSQTYISVIDANGVAHTRTIKPSAANIVFGNGMKASTQSNTDCIPLNVYGLVGY